MAEKYRASDMRGGQSRPDGRTLLYTDVVLVRKARAVWMARDVEDVAHYVFTKYSKYYYSRSCSRIDVVRGCCLPFALCPLSQESV